MANQGSRYLIKQLLNNKLSRAELDEFLAGLHDDQARQAYSDVLETYFNQLITQQNPSPDTDTPTSSI